MQKVNPLIATLLIFVAQPLSAQSFSAQDIGPDEAEHTSSTDGFRSNTLAGVSQSGFATGVAKRYAEDGSALGDTLWLYDGVSTRTFWLAGTQDSDTSGYREGSATLISENGVAAGTNTRYQSDDARGSSAWAYDSNRANPKPRRIGFYDADHTSRFGVRQSLPLALNSSGLVVGNSYQYYDAYSPVGKTLWTYDGADTLPIGLTDATHTFTTGDAHSATDNTFVALNDAGQVAGEAKRDGATGGQSAWLFNGAESVQIGLYNSAHTRVDGLNQNYVTKLDDAGRVLGYANRQILDPQGGGGRSVWLYNGTTTSVIGLVNAKHTYNGYFRYATAVDMNSSGVVLGYSRSYAAPGESGQSAWVYSGAASFEVGLLDDEYTRSDGLRIAFPETATDSGYIAGSSDRFDEADEITGLTGWRQNLNTGTIVKFALEDGEHSRSDGYRVTGVTDMNEAGLVLGWSNRYDDSDNGNGRNVILFDGSTTEIIGLTSATYTHPVTGFRRNTADILTENGEVAGQVRTTGESTYVYQAWFFDGSETISMGVFSAQANGDSHSAITHITDQGHALGYYRHYANPSSSESTNRPFIYHKDWGVIDLGSLIEPSLAELGWEYLGNNLGNYDDDGEAAVPTITATGEIIGEAVVDISGTLATTSYSITMNALDVEIDFIQWDSDNEIDLSVDNPVSVVIKTTDTSAGEAVSFDAMQIDPATVIFGPAGATPTQAPWYVNADSDSDTDAVFTFQTSDTGIVCEATEASISGKTYGGTAFIGSDEVNPINCETNNCHP